MSDTMSDAELGAFIAHRLAGLTFGAVGGIVTVARRIPAVELRVIGLVSRDRALPTIEWRPA